VKEFYQFLINFFEDDRLRLSIEFIKELYYLILKNLLFIFFKFK